MKVRVLIVEDDAPTRRALQGVLTAHGFEVVAAVATGQEALKAMAEARPGVALVDLGLPDLPGAEVVRRARQSCPGLPVLVLTVNEDSESLLGALRAGAQGYLLKGGTARELAEALRAVVDGDSPLSPAVARHLVRQVHQAHRDQASVQPITERERDVLQLLALGHSYPTIASTLGIGVGTVQTHIKALYRKLDVASKAEATLVASRLGLLAPQ